MSFWEPFYQPNNQTNQPNNQLDQQNTLLTPDIPPNITVLPNNKFRAYKCKEGIRIYLGTFNTLDAAVGAQMEYTMFGTIPTRQRIRKSTPLSELVEHFLSINGEYNDTI